MRDVRPPDPRPSRYCTFGEWLERDATPAQREIVRRVFPTLATKYGVTLDGTETRGSSRVEDSARTP
jgi:hypothetical protein